MVSCSPTPGAGPTATRQPPLATTAAPTPGGPGDATATGAPATAPAAPSRSPTAAATGAATGVASPAAGTPGAGTPGAGTPGAGVVRLVVQGSDNVVVL